MHIFIKSRRIGIMKMIRDARMKCPDQMVEACTCEDCGAWIEGPMLNGDQCICSDCISRDREQYEKDKAASANKPNPFNLIGVDDDCPF